MLARDAQNSGGIQLFVAARTEAKCQTLVRELQSLGATAEYMIGDLTDASFAPLLVAAVTSRFGRLDGVFNVAGISGRRYGDGPVHECTEEGWAITLNTNATTQYRVCREAVRVMLAQSPGDNGQRGVILNMASILGIHPEPKHFDTVAYAASKGAIDAFTRSLAVEVAPRGITVNAVAPGIIETEMSRQVRELAGDQIKSRILLRRIGQPDEVAYAVWFLSSRYADYITGQVLHVDGGFKME